MLKLIKYIDLIRIFIAILIGFILTIGIIYGVSEDASTTIWYFFLGPFSNISGMGNIFETATPLILTAVGTAIAFQAGLIYIGAGGAIFIGATMGTLIAIFSNAPTFIHIPFILLVALLAGAFIGYIPGYLRVKLRIHEFISSLMLNYIATFVGIYIIKYYARDMAAALLQSRELPKTAWFLRIIPGTRIHLGFILAIILSLLAYFFLYHTRWGYEIRMVGKNADFARFNGIDVDKVIVISTTLAGATAGIAGISEIMGIYHRFQWKALPCFSLEGILVVIIARNHPLLIIPVSFLIAYLKTGAQYAALIGDIPSEIVTIIISIIVFLVTAELFLEKWKQRLTFKEATKDELRS